MSKKPTQSENKTKKIIKIVAFVLVAVIVLGVVGIYTLSNSGIIERKTVAAKTENYTVTTPMLSYLYRTQYQNFVSNNSSYLQYFGLDTNKSLDSQEYAGGKTWHDYMLDSTRSQVKQSLVLCEAADKAGIKLDDADKKDIEDTLKIFDSYAASSKVTVEQYIKYSYGNSVKLSDIRKCMEILRLAEKYQEYLDSTYKFEKADWDKYYTENEDSFLKADYLQYTFKVETTTDSKKDSETTAADATAKAADTTTASAATEKEPPVEASYAEALKATTTPDEFKAYVENYLKTVKYVDFTAEELEEDDIDIAELVEGCLQEGKTVSGDTEFNKWASDEARAPYETYVVENKDKTQYDVYMILPAQNEGDLNFACLYREIYQLKTFRYIPVEIDSSAKDKTKALEEAKKDAEEILKKWKDNPTEDNFAKLAEENEHYYEGGLVEGAQKGVINDDFSDWVYSADRKEGDVEIIEDEEQGYFLVYYKGDYGVKWEMEANKALKEAKYADDYAKLEKETPVTYYKKGVNLVPSA